VDYLNALNLLSAGKLDVKPVVTHEIPLAQINEACELVHAKQAIKVVLTVEH
jgi:threonine dehydrogenase-like Zn-dependent dehydrogenase